MTAAGNPGGEPVEGFYTLQKGASFSGFVAEIAGGSKKPYQ